MSRAILAQVSGPVLVSGVVRGTVRGFLGMPLYATETVRTGPFALHEDPTLSSLLGTEGRTLIRYVDGSSVALAPRSTVIIFGSASPIRVPQGPPPLVEIDEEALKDVLGALGGSTRK